MLLRSISIERRGHASVTFKTVIFAESTLMHDEMQDLPDTYLMPAASRDTFREIFSMSVDRIIIIDGLFYAQRAVWQRDILKAIQNGIKVYGASSMGALRAAELFQYGMKGYGWIYKQYVQGRIHGDDEVSIIYNIVGDRVIPITYSLVSLRYLLARYSDINMHTKDYILERVKDLSFDQRTYHQISLVITDVVGERISSSVMSLLRNPGKDIKRLDAIGLISSLYRKTIDNNAHG